MSESNTGRAFDGKVAIVTGAASGIGLAAATSLAAQGAKVVLADRDEDGLTRAGESLPKAADVALVKTDVSDEASVREMVATAVDRFGRLDCAFNNAGILGTVPSLLDIELDDWKRELDINLGGIFLCLKHEIPAMLDGGGGTIVNTASLGGLVGYPTNAPYVASKHGVVGLTKAAALEFATRGIRVNAICPGFVDTPMGQVEDMTQEETDAYVAGEVPIGRMARAEEIANAALFLLGPEASYAQGTIFAIDGGYVAQ